MRGGPPFSAPYPDFWAIAKNTARITSVIFIAIITIPLGSLRNALANIGSRTTASQSEKQVGVGSSRNKIPLSHRHHIGLGLKPRDHLNRLLDRGANALQHDGLLSFGERRVLVAAVDRRHRRDRQMIDRICRAASIQEDNALRPASRYERSVRDWTQQPPFRSRAAFPASPRPPPNLASRAASGFRNSRSLRRSRARRSVRLGYASQDESK